MKNGNIFSLLFVVAIFVVSSSCYSVDFKPLDVKTAEKMWGKKKFNTREFKEGDYKTRSAMAVDIIISNNYKGKLLVDVKKELGKHDGYFQNDAVPAYLLTSKDSGPIWQLVFIPDEKWEKVKRVEIQRN